MNGQFKWSLVGIPDDQGVSNVGGRVGAAHGPAAFRAVFSRLRGQIDLAGHKAADQDVNGLGSDCAKNMGLATARVALEAARSALVVVGGGHDHGYSHLKGVKQGRNVKRLGCLNVDAHLDLRGLTPQGLITSGSPFYLAIEDRTLQGQDLVEFGIQTHCNSPDLWKYAGDHGVRVLGWKTLRSADRMALFEAELLSLTARCDEVVLSMDLDAACEAFAPGVSAPQTEGFSSVEMVAMAELAGKNPKVKSLGLFELNPLHDIGGRTARLAATMAYHFIESKALTD